MYSSSLSLTLALDEVGGQLQAPAALTLRKTRYPLYRRLGGPQGGSGRVRKISPSPGFDPQTIQPVASRYTDYSNTLKTEILVPCMLCTGCKSGLKTLAACLQLVYRLSICGALRPLPSFVFIAWYSGTQTRLLMK